MQNGITLIALVISIIVMLILAGVSINAIVGDNGILTNAQTATFAQKIATYKEELEMNIVGNSEDMLPDREKVTALNESIKQYISSIKEDDISKFGIIAGELYYLGDNKIEKEVCIIQNVKTKAEGQDLEQFIEQVENMALENILINMNGDAFILNDETGEDNFIGIKLYDKTLENSGKWKIIVEIDDLNSKATYGTGWYYVEAGSTVDGIGTLAQSYIINYIERKAVRFDSTKHSLLASGGDLAVKDNILFTIDPALIEEGINGNFEWLNNVEKFGFKNNFEGTFTNAAMYMNGAQYLAVPGDIGNVGDTGLTFEFYGKLETGGLLLDYEWMNKIPEEEALEYYTKLYNYENGKIIDIGDGVKYAYYQDVSMLTGLFSTSKNYTRSQRIFRAVTSKNEENNFLKTIQCTYGDKNNTLNAWTPTVNGATNGDTWNQRVPLEKENIDIDMSKKIYISLTFDPVNDEQKFYYNGELKSETNMNMSGWNAMMKDKNYQGDGYFLIGNSSQGQQGFWHTFRGEIYACHVYTRPLAANEITANYNASVAYHELLLDSNKGNTSGETGGEDIGNIN